MAIVDMKGTVSKDQATTTGMVNQTPTTVDAPQLSGMNKLFERINIIFWFLKIKITIKSFSR